MVEKDALMNVPSRPLTPPPNVNWFRFCSSTLNVTSSLSSPFSLGRRSGAPSIGLKYPSWLIRRIVALSASVLKTSPSFM